MMHAIAHQPFCTGATPPFQRVLGLHGAKSLILDALGGLYLTYDLLGGKNGPLRTITESLSWPVRNRSISGSKDVSFGRARSLSSIIKNWQVGW